MSTTVFEAVKGKELGGIIEGLNADPEKYFNVTISIEETEDSDEDMPPEERISQRLIDAVKRSEESYKAGNFTRCNSIEEDEAFFNKIWND